MVGFHAGAAALEHSVCGLCIVAHPEGFAFHKMEAARQNGYECSFADVKRDYDAFNDGRPIQSFPDAVYRPPGPVH